VEEGFYLTSIYFIRHAEPDISVHDDLSRPLTAKGQHDTSLVTKFLHDKNIEAVLSSPYKRAFDTVVPFASSIGLSVESDERFRERKVGSEWIEDFGSFSKKQWADMTYKLAGGECLLEVQERNIAALRKTLDTYQGRSIAIGTHGTALSTIINYYDKTYGFDDFEKMKHICPWVVHMDFEGYEFIRMEKIDLFN